MEAPSRDSDRILGIHVLHVHLYCTRYYVHGRTLHRSRTPEVHNVNMETKRGQLIKRVSGNAWLAELSDGSCEIIQSNDIQSARITDPYNFTEFVHVFEKGQIQTIFIRAIQTFTEPETTLPRDSTL